MTVFHGSQRSDPQNFTPREDWPDWRTLPPPRMVAVMYFNLAPGQTHVSIVRPLSPRVRIDDLSELDPTAGIMTFSPSEWAVFILSGLRAALDTHKGWKLWDEASAHRGPDVAEKDHLLVIASLLAQGRDLGQTFECFPGHRRATMAIRELAYRAASWRAQEGIPTPLTVFPDGSARLGQDLPDPIFQAPLLEHAVEATHVDVLIDLAKQGEEATFKDLAQTLGVPAAKLDELWAGTVRRVQR